MNCPCHVLIFKHGLRSYRELPLRMAEFGSCHRYEPSGALHGIMRVRAFTQDDAHIFCTEAQIADETVAFVALLSSVYRDFGFDSFRVKFSDRPVPRAGTDAVWDRAEGALKEACAIAGVEYELSPGEGAFYGPKLEFVLRDAIGRDWQCGTLQVDFVLPERLDADYISDDSSRQRPVMLHRAILGSFERFLGILIENYAGRFPLWLAPVQAVVASIVTDAAEYAEEVAAALRARGLEVRTDTRNEKINAKVREHSLAHVPVLVVVGRRGPTHPAAGTPSSASAAAKPVALVTPAGSTITASLFIVIRQSSPSRSSASRTVGPVRLVRRDDRPPDVQRHAQPRQLVHQRRRRRGGQQPVDAGGRRPQDGPVLADDGVEHVDVGEQPREVARPPARDQQQAQSPGPRPPQGGQRVGVHRPVVGDRAVVVRC